MDVPPSRYRVEERGRRLVVVDRATGDTVTGTHPAMDSAERPSRPSPQPSPVTAGRDRPAPTPPRARSQAGPPTAQITTSAWYDEKAPRTLTLPESARHMPMGIGAFLVAVALLGWLFLGLGSLFVIGFLALNEHSRNAMRGAVTSWLDQYDIG